MSWKLHISHHLSILRFLKIPPPYLVVICLPWFMRSPSQFHICEMCTLRWPQPWGRAGTQKNSTSFAFRTIVQKRSKIRHFSGTEISTFLTILTLFGYPRKRHFSCSQNRKMDVQRSRTCTPIEDTCDIGDFKSTKWQNVHCSFWKCHCCDFLHFGSRYTPPTSNWWTQNKSSVYTFEGVEGSACRRVSMCTRMSFVVHVALA